MRHSNSGKQLSRNPSHRKALLRNLAKALLTHGKIRTTEIKAKELRRVVEPLIALGLQNDLHARRQAYRVLGNHQLVKELFDVIAPPFAGIPGGFTRVIKLAATRRGDNASMAVIELTHSPTTEAPAEAAAPAPKAVAAKAPAAKAAKAAKAPAKEAAAEVEQA